MAEYIEREALLSTVGETVVFTVREGAQLPNAEMRGANKVIDRIKAAPAADVVEVVWCKDCKHWLKDVAGCTDFVGRCEWANYMVGAAGYCVYGEKMDEKGEGDGSLPKEKRSERDAEE